MVVNKHFAWWKISIRILTTISSNGHSFRWAESCNTRPYVLNLFWHPARHFKLYEITGVFFNIRNDSFLEKTVRKQTLHRSWENWRQISSHCFALCLCSIPWLLLAINDVVTLQMKNQWPQWLFVIYQKSSCLLYQEIEQLFVRIKAYIITGS